MPGVRDFGRWLPAPTLAIEQDQNGEGLEVPHDHRTGKRSRPGHRDREVVPGWTDCAEPGATLLIPEATVGIVETMSRADRSTLSGRDSGPRDPRRNMRLERRIDHWCSVFEIPHDDRRISPPSGVSLDGVSQRKEILMKRMMLLTSLIMVFSLFTAAAAVAGQGPGAGEGGQVGETVMSQTQERAQVHAEEAPCAADDEAPECEPARERTQAREQIQVRDYDGECVGTDADCEAVQDRIQARDRDQVRLNDGTCTDEGSECEPVREMTRAQAYERIMERIAAYNGGSGEGEYLFAMVRWMWTHMYGPLSTLFL